MKSIIKITIVILCSLNVIQSQTIAYTFDNLGRLTSTVYPDITEIFTYDAVGNRLSKGFCNTINIDLKVFLEGPFNGTDMNTNLNPGSIPVNNPFSSEPWNYSGKERVTAIPNPDIVDWVLVELRETPYSADSATSNTTIARQAGFLLKDATVTGLDGISPIRIGVPVSDNLFVIVWHRNHLGVLSAMPLVESGEVYTYDFTTGADKVYGGVNGCKELAPGIWGMIAGDSDGNGQINNQDKDDFWLFLIGTTGYTGSDFNMDGNVDLNDIESYWDVNSGKGCRVPE